MWPYLLGHYKWSFTSSDIAETDARTQSAYENKLSDWMAIEAIVRQRDKETTAANIAKLSQSQTTVNNESSFNMSNKVFEDEEEEEEEDGGLSSRTVSTDKISTITEVTEENSTSGKSSNGKESSTARGRQQLLSTQSEPGSSGGGERRSGGASPAGARAAANGHGRGLLSR